jgi:hypothetical protein
MTFIEPIGYLASALVLTTFCMRDMAALRCLAIASNLAFIAYGALAGLGPVLVLHLLLLPVNLLRLVDVRRSAALAERDAQAAAQRAGRRRRSVRSTRRCWLACSQRPMTDC